MPWVRADRLKVGQKTANGQEVLDIVWTGVQYQVTWQPTHTRRKVTIGYFPDQEFDMAPTGAPSPQEETKMAQKVNIVVTSDLSDQPNASTVEFGLDGTTYEIDLTDKEASKFRDVLAQYVGAGRKVSGSRSRSRRGSSQASGGPSAATIRAWAAENGHEVPARGRIPSEVREAYVAAH